MAAFWPTPNSCWRTIRVSFDKWGLNDSCSSGGGRSWSLTAIPVASARLTDELLYQDTLMQRHPLFWRERSVACPAPHGTLAVYVLAHPSVVSANGGRSLKRMYREGSAYTSNQGNAVAVNSSGTASSHKELLNLDLTRAFFKVKVIAVSRALAPDGNLSYMVGCQTLSTHAARINTRPSSRPITYRSKTMDRRS